MAQELDFIPVSGPAVRRGFTLVELLSVIAIVAVLFTILIPVLSSIRATSQVTGCTSNLRNCHAAIQLYVNEHGAYPRPFTSTGSYQTSWWQRLAKEGYFAQVVEGSNQKTETLARACLGCPAVRDELNDSIKVTYSMNNHLSEKTPETVRHFSSCMLLIDGWRQSNGAYSPAIWNGGPAPEHPHTGSTNILFVDGRVEAVPTKEVPYKAQDSISAEEVSRFWN